MLGGGGGEGGACPHTGVKRTEGRGGSSLSVRYQTQLLHSFVIFVHLNKYFFTQHKKRSILANNSSCKTDANDSVFILKFSWNKHLECFTSSESRVCSKSAVVCCYNSGLQFDDTSLHATITFFDVVNLHGPGLSFNYSRQLHNPVLFFKLNYKGSKK